MMMPRLTQVLLTTETSSMMKESYLKSRTSQITVNKGVAAMFTILEVIIRKLEAASKEEESLYNQDFQTST